MSSNSTETKGGSAVGQLKSLACVSVMRRLRGYTWVSDRHSGTHGIFLPFVICCSVRMVQTLPSTTCLLSQDCFPMVQQHGHSEESLRLTAMLFATCSSFTFFYCVHPWLTSFHAQACRICLCGKRVSCSHTQWRRHCPYHAMKCLPC